jgi:hypothetical protein
MKICAVCLLLFVAAFPLYAQTPPVFTMFIPPVTGTGLTPEDNDFFTDILNREMKSWNFILTETPDEASFALVGTLAPADGGGTILFLDLQDKDGITMYGQELHYTTLEEANTYLYAILLFMLSGVFVFQVTDVIDQVVPVEEIIDLTDPDAWRNKDWYFGAGAFWNPRIYHGLMTSGHLLNFSFGLSAEYHLQKYSGGNRDFLKYAAVGTGLEVASDWVVASLHPRDYYRNTILQIPLLLNFVIKPGDRFMHAPYAGILFNIPFFPDTAPFPVSWATGFQFGYKIGPGIAFAEASYSMDFGKSGLNRSRPSDTRQYNRFIIQIGVGYKYGFFPKRKEKRNFNERIMIEEITVITNEEEENEQ